MATRPAVTKRQTSAGNGRFPSDYVVPVVHVHLPEPVVKVGFYGGLATAVALGTRLVPGSACWGRRGDCPPPACLKRPSFPDPPVTTFPVGRTSATSPWTP